MPSSLSLREAAQNTDPVGGLTHDFYRYPARFSPLFARTAIELFSKPGELVVDPFMGGGTTAVESFASGRRYFGSDINSLSLFIARAKTTPIAAAATRSVSDWAYKSADQMSYRNPLAANVYDNEDQRLTNLHLPTARPIKKAIGIALERLNDLPLGAVQDYARCLVLRTSQWALDNRKTPASLADFRMKLATNADLMSDAMAEYRSTYRRQGLKLRDRSLVQSAVEELHDHQHFAQGQLADLVVTSPPYPGVHVLYHRWQVDGRRETPAPYWITNSIDGHGASHYTFGDRKNADETYFRRAAQAIESIRGCLRFGAYIVQMIAFSEPTQQLRRYLRIMDEAGFHEVKPDYHRIRRSVPNRKWHANFKGQTSSSREIVLVHRAC